MPPVPILLRCFTSGVTFPGPMDTAPPNYFLVSNKEPACLCFLLKFFSAAARSKDTAHDRSKLDHDRSKSFLPTLSPGQAVRLQDPKTSAWTRKGIVSSIRPDHLSYVVSVDGQSFIRPRCMLRAYVQLPLRSALHQLRPPLRLHLYSHVARNVFNRVLPLFRITHPRMFCFPLQIFSTPLNNVQQCSAHH